jgi:hypothetical protein
MRIWTDKIGLKPDFRNGLQRTIKNRQARYYKKIIYFVAYRLQDICMTSALSASRSKTHAPGFGSRICFENAEAFQANIPVSTRNDILRLGDAPYRSPDWDRFEKACTSNRENVQPIPCYPWGVNTICSLPEIYTGSAITGTGGGVTDGRKGVRFHFDCQPENLTALAEPTESSTLKRPLSAHIDNLNPQGRSALVIGGNVSLPEYAKNSREVFNNILNFFQEKQIKPSYFWGQDSGQDTMAQTRAYYTANDDTWHILKITKNPDTKEVSGPPKSITDLMRTFRKVHLDSNDTLYLPSGEVGVKIISATKLNLAAKFSFVYQFINKIQTLLQQGLMWLTTLAPSDGKAS